MKSSKNWLYLLLGASFFVQATTSFIGGFIGIGPFTLNGNMATDMHNIAGNIKGVYTGMFLQIVTALVIIVLAAALYQAGSHINKTAAIVAAGFYLVEAVIHIVGQFVIFAIAETSVQFVSGGDYSLITAASLLFATRSFIGAIAMMPFGLGAIIFYYLITKAKVIPNWIGLWGLITAPVVLIVWTLKAFNVVSAPLELNAAYVPWEWVTGIYIFIKGFKTK